MSPSGASSATTSLTASGRAGSANGAPPMPPPCGISASLALRCGRFSRRAKLDFAPSAKRTSARSASTFKSAARGAGTAPPSCDSVGEADSGFTAWNCWASSSFSLAHRSFLLELLQLLEIAGAPQLAAAVEPRLGLLELLRRIDAVVGHRQHFIVFRLQIEQQAVDLLLRGDDVQHFDILVRLGEFLLVVRRVVLGRRPFRRFRFHRFGKQRSDCRRPPPHQPALSHLVDGREVVAFAFVLGDLHLNIVALEQPIEIFCCKGVVPQINGHQTQLGRRGGLQRFACGQRWRNTSCHARRRSRAETIFGGARGLATPADVVGNFVISRGRRLFFSLTLGDFLGAILFTPRAGAAFREFSKCVDAL